MIIYGLRLNRHESFAARITYVLLLLVLSVRVLEPDAETCQSIFVGT